MPEAVVALGEEKRIVGRLRFEADGARQHSRFDYADGWLAASDRFALSPGLPLRPGPFFSSGREDSRGAVAGAFGDAAPDSWGRDLLQRALGGGLTEFDLLVRSDDGTRQGALRFLDDDIEPLSDLAPPAPRLVDLDRLRAMANRFERDPEGAGDDLLDLAGAASSLGGARPKANVEDDGAPWIAKFTSRRDTRPVERAEVAALRLAAACGLRAAEARLELPQGDAPVALVRRFDRRGRARVPYMSARTALDMAGAAPGSYSEIADVVRRISSRPSEDMEELWKRIVFTILVTNTDDHLKNHGFVYVGGDRWRLSPAFDVNPSPRRQRRLETSIAQGGPFDASIELALDGAGLFGVGIGKARGIAAGMAAAIRAGWRSALSREGVTRAGIEAFRDAFEHEEADAALRLAA